MSESPEPQTAQQTPEQIAEHEEIASNSAPQPADNKRDTIRYLRNMYVRYAVLFLSFTAVFMAEIFLLLSVSRHTITYDRVGWAAQALPYALLVPLIYYVAVVFHESGHLIAVCMVGFRCQGGNIGPLVITRAKQGIRFDFDRSPARSGAVKYLCRGRRFLRLRSLMVTLAGPLSSLIWCVPATIIAIIVMQQAIAQQSTNLLGIGIVVVWLALVNLIMGIGNLIPFTRIRKTGKLATSDGMKIWRYLRSDPSVEFEMVVMSMRSHVLISHNLQSCPAELVRRLQILLSQQKVDPKSPYQFLAAYFLYYLARYADDIPHALEYTTFLEQIDQEIRAKLLSLRLDRGYFAARYLLDQVGAQERLEKFQVAADSGLDRLRIKAALELRAGNYQQAIERAQEGLALMEAKQLDMADLKARDLKGIIAEAQKESGHLEE